MRRRRDPVPRAREAWWWLGGFLTLGMAGGAVVAAAIVLWENIDIRRLTPALAEAAPVVPVPELPAPAAAPRLSFEAVMLRSDASRAHFDDPEYYGLELERWSGLLRQSGAVVSEAGGAEDLRGLRADQLLVLAEAPCLSSAELAALNAHVRRGGSVLANWAVGVRDGGCEWRGWSTLLDLTGVYTSCFALLFASITWAVVQPWWTYPFGEFAESTSLQGSFDDVSVPVWALVTWTIVLGTIVPFALSCAPYSTCCS